MMTGGGNLYLNLQDFDNHIKTSWKLGQSELDFCDVTLACEDQYIKAHKFIICSVSPVFKNILKYISHQTAFIYLTGVKHKHLQNILSFIYQGEVNVNTEDLSSFFQLANDLNIKGLSKDINHEKDFAIDETIEKGNIKNQYNEDKFDNQTDITSHNQDFLEQNTSKENVIPITALNSCDKCSKQYNNTSKLKDHIKVAHEGFRFTCDQCDFTSKDHDYFRVHKKSVHMGIHEKCDECGKKYSRIQKLREHIKSAHKDIRYICDNCDYISVLKRDLRSHKCNEDKFDIQTDITSHNQDFVEQNTSEENFIPITALNSCDKCSKQYNSISRLKDHVKVAHEGFRFTCDQCDFSSKDHGYFRVHTKSVHMGIHEKCDECGKKYSRIQKLREHIKSAHKDVQYICDNCDYISLLKRDLKSHIKKRSEGVSYNCKMCDYTGCTKVNVQGHMKATHFEDPI